VGGWWGGVIRFVGGGLASLKKKRGGPAFFFGGEKNVLLCVGGGGGGGGGGGEKRRETTGILVRGEQEVGGEMTGSETPGDSHIKRTELLVVLSSFECSASKSPQRELLQYLSEY